MMDRVVLKKGRDKSIRQGHPWIFSGAIENSLQCSPGTILPIYSSDGEFLAQGYFNPDQSLAGRIFTWKEGEAKALLKESLENAHACRKRLGDLKGTNAYRLVNGEGDGIPGLIVDVYGEIGVIQIHTSGVEALRSFFVECLEELLDLKGIYEKSTSPARLEEGLEPFVGVLLGEVPESVEIEENGLRFLVSPSLGQKTGFFLDQRAMRLSLEGLARGKSVLSLFSYTGGFGLFALKGGALKATSVDISESACAFAQRNKELNGLEAHEVIVSDAFAYLENEPLDQDLVLLDPPAFAKKKRHQAKALKGYERLNFLALSKMKKGSLLMTSSCSHHIDES
ncbi:MAG: class I SAM-dependent rRNA methyltransferase, partial [Gammaproteobacteria bacterium]|nr:class I SAM-dependent rRNA methyltransferase [Gammaproteobacteria bacterium]